MKKILHLHVKKKYWLQVKNEEKDEEYRLVNRYWRNRLHKHFDEIHYHWGYPKKTQKSRTLIFPWNNFTIKKITHELFGENEYVFAIRLKK